MVCRIPQSAGLEGFWVAAAPVGNRQTIKRPQSVEKVQDIVDLYMAPPDYALVLSVDTIKSRYKLCTAPNLYDTWY